MADIQSYAGLFVAAALLANSAWNANLRADELDDAIALADKLDPGWRIEQIMAKRQQTRPPDAQNSVVQVERALALLPKDWQLAQPGDDLNEQPRGLRLDTQISEISTTQFLPANLAIGLNVELDELLPAVVEARKLVNFPNGQTNLKFARNAIATALDYAQNTRRLTRLLRLDVIRRVQNRDWDGAIESVRATIDVARSVGDEPTLISQLVRIAIDTVAVRALERVLAHGSPSEQALRPLQAELEREAVEPRFLYGMRGERAIFFDVVGKMAKGELSLKDLSDATGEEATRSITPNLLTAAYYRHNQALGLKKLTEMVEIAKRPLHEQPAALGAIEEEIAKLSTNPILRMSNMLVLMFLPAAYGGSKADQRSQCTLQAAAVSVACRRFHLANRRWPSKLEELIPKYLHKIPIDPYTGDPLIMRATSDGLLIYGLGEDRQDNQGNLSPRGLATPGFDVGVRMYNPPAPGR